jgi:prevent-host-death family protein
MARKEQVSVRELRQNLSVYLRRVKAGEALEVTERGRPVATLRPLTPGLSPGLQALLDEGRLQPAIDSRHDDLELPLKLSLRTSASQVLQEQREDRV